MLADQREHALFQAQCRAFLDADLGPLGGAAKRGEHRHLRIERQAVIAPMPGRDHPPVKVEDPLQLAAVEGGDGVPVPRVRERRDHAQALFALGAAWARARSSATS